MIDVDLQRRIGAFIDARADGSSAPDERDELLTELLALQARTVAPLANFLASEQRRPVRFGLPALPTDAFRFARIAAHPADRDQRVFRTSGTTAAFRGEHSFEDLSLYDRAARAAARYALFPDRERMRLLVLAPSERELPDSSLSYMLTRFGEWFGSERSVHVWRRGQLQADQLLSELSDAQEQNEPVALLGTSFAFVHAEDALHSRLQLPAGSRIMQTGGFKGRSRSVEPAAMLELLSLRYGVPAELIVSEYGMTELSSQCYENTLHDVLSGQPVPQRRLWVPGWMRAEVVDPDTLEPVASGQVGLLRLDDLANVGSVCAIQTSDLAQRDDAGLVVLGRAPDAIARGCSIAVDAWLGG
jgi:acyl-CoA synthetase (AMP-forming)/AMP-acid ligase II